MLRWSPEQSIIWLAFQLLAFRHVLTIDTNDFTTAFGLVKLNRNVWFGCRPRYWFLRHLNLVTLLIASTILPWCRLHRLWLLRNELFHNFWLDGFDVGEHLQLILIDNWLNLMIWNLIGASKIARCFYMRHGIAPTISIFHRLRRQLLMGKLILIRVDFPPLFASLSWRCFCKVHLFWY